MAKEEFIFNVNTLVGCNYSILRELKREYKVEKQYRNKFFWSQMASMTTTGLSYFDKMRYDSLSKNLEIIKPPIYILGHWRSGTTLLHNLLCSFKGTVYPTTYHSVFPNNIFFLRGLIKQIMQYYLPEKRLVDRLRMHVDLPQEEDFGLGNEAGYSFYYWFYFPKDHQRITNEFLFLPSEDQLRNKIYRERYIRFIERCIMHLGGDQYVAKNPPNTARIPFLMDLFPESRYIYIERNPYEVLISSFRFFKGFLKTLQLQDIDDDSLWDFIYDTYVTLYNKYQEDKKLIPPSNLVELKYENVVADLGLTLKTLNQGLLSDMKADETKLRFILEEHKMHKANTYSFDKSYINKVNEKLGGLIEKQGYKLL